MEKFCPRCEFPRAEGEDVCFACDYDFLSEYKAKYREVRAKVTEVSGLLPVLVDDFIRDHFNPTHPIGWIRAAKDMVEYAPPVEALLRFAMKRGLRVTVKYEDQSGKITERWISPTCFYRGKLVAYCYLRQARRNFFVEKIRSIHFNVSDSIIFKN